MPDYYLVTARYPSRFNSYVCRSLKAHYLHLPTVPKPRSSLTKLLKKKPPLWGGLLVFVFVVES